MRGLACVRKGRKGGILAWNACEAYQQDVPVHPDGLAPLNTCPLTRVCPCGRDIAQ